MITILINDRQVHFSTQYASVIGFGERNNIIMETQVLRYFLDVAEADSLRSISLTLCRRLSSVPALISQ